MLLINCLVGTFDRALVTLFQSATADGYMDVIWRSFQSEPTAASFLAVLWVSVTMMTTWLLFGIFVAIVTGTYDIISTRGKESRKNVTKGLLSDDTIVYRSEVQDAQAFQDERELIKLKERLKETTYLYQKILTSPYYRLFASLCILGHCIALAGNQDDVPEEFKTFVKVADILFNAVFAVELLLRLLAAGFLPQLFIESKSNVFETILVICGIMGVYRDNRALSAVPSARLFRLMKYTPTLDNLKELTMSLPVASIIAFIFICMLCFAITGQHFLGFRMPDTRSNFDSFPEAVLTTFQLFCGDGWSGVLFSAMNANIDRGRGTMVFCGIVIILWFVMSNFVIMNLIVGIIIDQFDLEETFEIIKRPGNFQALRRSSRSAWQNLAQVSGAFVRGDVRVDVNNSGRLYDPIEHTFNLRTGREGQVRQAILDADASHITDDGRKSGRGELGKKATVDDEKFQTSITKSMAAGGHFGSSPRKSFGSSPRKGFSARKCSQLINVVKAATVKYLEVKVEEVIENETVLGFITQGSRTRRFFLWLGKQWWFSTIIYCAIITSCIFLAFQPPSGVSAAGTQFSCFTSTKVQILTPEERRHATYRPGLCSCFERPHSAMGRVWFYLLLHFGTFDKGFRTRPSLYQKCISQEWLEYHGHRDPSLFLARLSFVFPRFGQCR